MISINAERLLADLRALAKFGKVETGVTRLALSEVDMESRQWLVERMADAGLDAAIDGVGNVFGRSKALGPAVLIGSHTDSVPRGGWLDGAMGVLYGLEIARALEESELGGKAGIDVISFQDEEGTFFGFLGSRSFFGDLEDADIAGATNLEGDGLADVLDARGLFGKPRVEAETGRYRGYFEAHIEQGPRLEAAGKRIGVVTGIVGYRRHRVRFNGQADHAGTTPLSMRKDAGKALIAFGWRLDVAFREIAAEDSVWTFGNATFAPGAFNVVPGEAELLVEYRDTSPDVLDAFEACVERLVRETDGKGPADVEHTQIFRVESAMMDSLLAEHIFAAAEAHGEEPMRMPSGAGHDAMVVAGFLPSAMMFVPSIGGRSHDVAEDTAEADITAGCQVFAIAVSRALLETG